MVAVRQVLLGAAVLLVAMLRGGCAEWTEEKCAEGIANIATEARACQEQAAGAGREISGQIVRGEPVCSEVSGREADLALGVRPVAQSHADARATRSVA
jgi:hypothetical protein|eukprot:COSAG02_NODE_16621_length_1070_cov_0.885685_1_plen_99_part_00